MFDNLFVYNVFIYITEKCNLNCDYCYFKDKRGRTLDFSAIKRFIDFLKTNLATPCNFEISGGEPFLFFPLVKKTVNYIKKKFPKINIGIQTNGLLLNEEIISFLKDNKISLEIGIDGDFFTTSKHRRGIDRDSFEKLIKNIKKCKEKGIDISCTMTVHPQESCRLSENFSFLINLGLRNIDVTPSALIEWDVKSIECFKKEYIKIVKNKKFLKHIFMEEDFPCLKKNLLDLSLHPPFYVFFGDVFLCLSENMRKKWSFLKLDNGRIKVNEKIFYFFIKKTREYFDSLKTPLSYRDYVSWGFKMISKFVDKDLDFKETIFFQNFLKKIHLKSILT